MKLEWTTEKRRVKDLIPTDKNPRKLSEKGRRRLEEKIQKLGVFEIPAIDHEGKLLNFNQRLRILLALGKGEEILDVRIPNRPVTDEERKEIVLSSNLHEGEWDVEILENDYADVDMESLGLDEAILREVEESLQQQEVEEGFEPDEPEYPITAKFAEQYSAFVIVAANEIDANFLAEALGTEMEQCYKSSHVGTSHVISAKKFIDRWKQSKS